jgi:hypothetical protein
MPNDIPDTKRTRKVSESRAPWGTCNVPRWPGVSWSEKKQKWQAYINYKKKMKHLGWYRDYNDAINARLRAEEDHAMGALFDD